GRDLRSYRWSLALLVGFRTQVLDDGPSERGLPLEMLRHPVDQVVDEDGDDDRRHENGWDTPSSTARKGARIQRGERILSVWGLARTDSSICARATSSPMPIPVG